MLTRFICSVCLLLFLTNFQYSQTQQEINTVLLTVSVVKVIYGDSCDVVISGDNFPEINKNYRGRVFGKYDEKTPGRDIEIGN